MTPERTGPWLRRKYDRGVADNQFPSNPEDLAGSTVEMPRLTPDTAESCPRPIEQIVEYLRTEAYPEELTDTDLEFLRTASVEGVDYWTWRFTESEGSECFVTVSRRGSETTVGYEENYDGLTPEQFMLAESRGWI